MAKVDILNYISDSNILRSTYDTDTNELDITDVPQNLNSVITLGQGGGAEVEELNVTANGTYTAPEGHAYSPVNVNVPVPAFKLTDFKVPSSKWDTKNSIPNYLASGGCVHIRITVPQSPLLTADESIIAVGTDLTNWSSTTNTNMFFLVYQPSERPDHDPANFLVLRLKGSVINGVLWICDYAHDGIIDLKFYADKMIDVISGDIYTYSGDSTFNDIAQTMSNLQNYSYISVGYNLTSIPFTGLVISNFSIEPN